jgi:hypothetical protein
MVKTLHTVKNIFSAFLFSGFIMVSASAMAGNQPEPTKSEPTEIKETIPQTNEMNIRRLMRDRLLDPGYDVRFNRGTILPWHDTKSTYLRRTIPTSHLAGTYTVNTKSLLLT